jgi:hypothetical protein
VAETVLVETANIWRREGKEIFPEDLENLEKLGSGVWVIRPENDLAFLHERESAHQYIMRLEQFNASPLLVEYPAQRVASELLDVDASADVAASGDWYITKRIPAGESWEQPLSPVEAGPVVNSPHYPLDTMMMGPRTGSLEPNSGFIIKVLIPGGFLQTGDYLFSFRFGGELIGSASPPLNTGFGRFEMILSGSGTIFLYEKISGSWEKVAEWQSSAYKDLSGSALIFRVLPHFPRYIEFRTFASVGVQSSLQELHAPGIIGAIATTGRHITIHEHTHIVENRGSQATFGGSVFLRPITGEGPIVIRVRRDLRLAWQVARLAFRQQGVLTDRAFRVPYGVADAKILRIHAKGYNQQVSIDPSTALTTMTAIVEEADGTALTPASESVTLNGQSFAFTGFFPPGGSNKCRAVITLTSLQVAGARWHSPALEAYHVVRNPHTVTLTTTENTNGEVQSVSIQGAGYHPEHEAATLVVDDPRNLLTTVRNRKTPVIIETTYNSGGVDKSIIFRGYTGRVTASQRGKIGTTYPSPDWRQLNCELVGMWDRLSANRFWHQQINLADATTSLRGGVGNSRVPWYVTDFIREAIWMSGFPDAQINVPHVDLRFFLPKNSDTTDGFVIPPGTNLAELLVSVARDYLNHYLVFCPNAGADGQWRLLSPPTGAETPLWTFTLEAAAAGKLAHLAASYGSNISPILSIEGSDYRSFTVPPEGNALTVTGRTQPASQGALEALQQQDMNFRSFRAPGFTSQADPTSIDWLGYIKPIEYSDPTLETQGAVNFVTRRIANLALYGRRMHSFTAQAVLVNAAAVEPTVYTTRTHRPLRAGDVCGLKDRAGTTTKCVIHSANIYYEKSHAMSAFYEMEELRVGATIPR